MMNSLREFNLSSKNSTGKCFEDAWINKCHFGDVRDVLQKMIKDGVKVNSIVTSPPYWGLRQYMDNGIVTVNRSLTPAKRKKISKEIAFSGAIPSHTFDDGSCLYHISAVPEHLHQFMSRSELGLEKTIHEFIANMVEVFELLKQVLTDDGTAWVNMGDCYLSTTGSFNEAPRGGTQKERDSGIRGEDKYAKQGGLHQPNRTKQEGLKNKDLVGQPWRLALALQDAGWWLRSDIIWAKPSAMPESCRDRPTKSHEYVFLLSKSERYFFNFEAFQEPVTGNSHPRKKVNGWDTGPGNHSTIEHNTPKSTGVGFGRGSDAEQRNRGRVKNNASMDKSLSEVRSTRNRRSVWTIANPGYAGAHFATFPEALVEPCLLASMPPEGIVLDPFFGTGTTGSVAQRMGWNFIGIDLNKDNEILQKERISQKGFSF